MRTLLVALLLASIAAIWIAAFSLHSTLPEKIPLHFDFSGTPDRWGPSSFGNWFLIPIIATAIPALLVGIVPLTNVLLNRCPSIVNVPRKEKLLMLGLDARARALVPLSTMMLSLSILILWMMLYIIIGTSRVALGTWATLPIWPVFVQIPALLGLVLWNHWKLARAIDGEFLLIQLDRR